MKLSNSEVKVTLTEDEIREAIELYLKSKDVSGKVKHVNYKHGTRTESCGWIEHDVPYKEGAEITVEMMG